MWSGHDLISMEYADAGEARALLARAHSDDFSDELLKGKAVANLFFEDSTRTRVSFSRATQLLGGDVLDLSGKGSSISKGETLIDTAQTIESMGVDALVVRVSEMGAPRRIAEHVEIPVINAGDGTHQHPTQALGDAMTIGRAFGRTDEWDLSGLRVAIVGDVISSRVAGSNIGLISALGAQITLVGPTKMVDETMASNRCSVSHELDAVLEDADVMMMLRVQFERGSGDRLSSTEAYHDGYGLTQARADRMKARAIVMHPGPTNRGVEIDSSVADGERSHIRNQVTHGVLARKAVLAGAIAGM